MKRYPSAVWMLACVVLLLGSAPTARAADAAPANEERWFVVRFQDQRAGWMRAYSEVADGKTTSGMQMHLAIRRGAAKIEMDMAMAFTETADGKPISATTSQTAAWEQLTKTMTFTDNGRRVVTVQGGREHVRELPPIEGEWLTPGRAAEHLEKGFESGQREFRYRMLDLSLGDDPVEIHTRVTGEEDIDVFGKTVRAWRTVSTTSATPNIESAEWVDEDGELMRSTVDLGGLTIEILAADKALATAEVDAPELMASTLVKPGFGIRDPRGMRTARYRLSVAKGKMPDLPTTIEQRVDRIDDRTVRVVIDLDAEPGAKIPRPEIEHTPMIDGSDEKIVELAKQATRGVGDDPAARAEAMRRFVRRYIRHANLSVGSASASEVARARSGDCTEHGVLLAALLKADGIPAEAASGLIYVRDFIGESNVFGYHMWTRAWIDGRWVDLDATLDEGPYDAAHILLHSSNLADGAADNDMITMVPLIGQLKIDWASED